MSQFAVLTPTMDNSVNINSSDSNLTNPSILFLPQIYILMSHKYLFSPKFLQKLTLTISSS